MTRNTIEDPCLSISNVTEALRLILNSDNPDFEPLAGSLALCCDELDSVENWLQYDPGGGPAPKERKTGEELVAEAEAEKFSLLAPYIDRAVYEAFEHLNEDVDRVRRAEALITTLINGTRLDTTVAHALELAEQALEDTAQHLHELHCLDRTAIFTQSVIDHVSQARDEAAQ